MNHEADGLDGESVELDLDSLFADPDPGCLDPLQVLGVKRIRGHG
jgi:hypothetical protein